MHLIIQIFIYYINPNEFYTHVLSGDLSTCDCMQVSQLSGTHLGIQTELNNAVI